MRDVSYKANTLRTAKAQATLVVSESTIEAIKTGNVPKADPLVVAKVAGIQAAKNTSVLIPYCHQVPLDYVGIDIQLHSNAMVITADVKAIWKTGVEMEALAGASAVALTLYDMLKIIDEKMEITSITLLEKTGGKSSIKQDGKGLKAAILVLSDSVSKGTKQDRSGKVLDEKLKALKLEVSAFTILSDDQQSIESELIKLVDIEKVDLILTTGGTGVSPRDVTPEATLAIIDRRLDGIEETLRRYGQDRLPTAMFSRCIVGVRNQSIIINFPGSVGGVTDGMNAIFPSVLHVFKMVRGGGHE